MYVDDEFPAFQTVRMMTMRCYLLPWKRLSMACDSRKTFGRIKSGLVKQSNYALNINNAPAVDICQQQICCYDEFFTV